MNTRCLAAALLGTLLASNALAATVIEEWSAVKAPTPPELKPVTLDPKTTALLLLDFNGRNDAASGPCNSASKPRCLASVPMVRGLLDRAQKAGLFVIYSLSSNGSPDDIQAALKPRAGDPVVKSGPDKFIGTALRDRLAGKGIATVIITGTGAEGAVLDTATDAALNGMSVVIPVDGMSSTELYAEQYVAWHVTHAPGVSQKTALTRTDLITFGPQ